MKSFRMNLRIDIICLIHLLATLPIFYFRVFSNSVALVIILASLAIFGKLTNVNISHYFCINSGKLYKRATSLKLLCTTSNKDFIKIIQDDLISNAIPGSLELIKPGQTLSIETHLLPSNDLARNQLIGNVGATYKYVEKPLCELPIALIVAWFAWHYKKHIGISDSRPALKNKQWYKITLAK